MLISRDVIDSSFNTRDAMRDAHNKAMFEQIVSNIGALNALEKKVCDIIETLLYISIKDDKVACAFRNEISSVASKHKLDFYNAVNYNGEKRWAFGPNYLEDRSFYRNIFICDNVVLFSLPNDSQNSMELTEENLKRVLGTEHYGSFLKSVLHLVNTIPAYSAALSENLNNILSDLK